jgi:hypothetical protein
VSPHSLLLSLLITLRLLMPPGICVCTLSCPAAQLIIALCGAEPTSPPTPPEEDDDHLPGCPASYLAAGLGVAPPSGPGLITLPWTGFLRSAAIVPPASAPLPSHQAISFPSLPRYLELCALLC